MADAPRPFEAYKGDEDFVFVSYAHADAGAVYPDLKLLKDAGFNVYYDEGISPGSRWTSELADAIENCTVFLAFLSPSAVGSENCTNEVEFAVSRRKPILIVHVAETEMPAGLELSLGGRQALMKHELGQASYRGRLQEALQKALAGEDIGSLTPGKVNSSRRGMLVALLAVAALGTTFLFDFRLLNQESTEVGEQALRLAIAVRPFDTSAADPQSLFFANGVADDLVMRLGHWRNLPVVARGTSFAPDLPADPVAAGRALNARYLVEGTVRSQGDVVKLTVFLVDATDGSSLWSREYQPTSGTALTVQAEIADSIVTQINPALIAAETERAVRADPATLNAWSAAMRGWWHLNQETREDLTEAQNWFREATQRDPTWSWPHSARALSDYRALINNWAEDPRSVSQSMIGAANKAVQLDARDAFAHHALGHAYAIQGQIDDSLNALARGVELAPNDPMANGCYAMQLAASARADEAQAVIAHAMALSPEDPWLHRFALVKARAHFAAAQYPDSEEWALRSQQLRPSSGAFFHSVAAPALGSGLDRARQRVEDARAQGPLAPLPRIEQGFRRSTDPDYVGRLLNGLRRAGFE